MNDFIFGKEKIDAGTQVDESGFIGSKESSLRQELRTAAGQSTPKRTPFVFTPDEGKQVTLKDLRDNHALAKTEVRTGLIDNAFFRTMEAANYVDTSTDHAAFLMRDFDTAQIEQDDLEGLEVKAMVKEVDPRTVMSELEKVTVPNPLYGRPDYPDQEKVIPMGLYWRQLQAAVRNDPRQAGILYNALNPDSQEYVRNIFRKTGIDDSEMIQTVPPMSSIAISGLLTDVNPANDHPGALGVSLVQLHRTLTTRKVDEFDQDRILKKINEVGMTLVPNIEGTGYAPFVSVLRNLNDMEDGPDKEVAVKRIFRDNSEDTYRLLSAAMSDKSNRGMGPMFDRAHHLAVADSKAEKVIDEVQSLAIYAASPDKDTRPEIELKATVVKTLKDIDDVMVLDKIASELRKVKLSATKADTADTSGSEFMGTSDTVELKRTKFIMDAIAMISARKTALLSGEVQPKKATETTVDRLSTGKPAAEAAASAGQKPTSTHVSQLPIDETETEAAPASKSVMPDYTTEISLLRAMPEPKRVAAIAALRDGVETDEIAWDRGEKTQYDKYQRRALYAGILAANTEDKEEAAYYRSQYRWNRERANDELAKIDDGELREQYKDALLKTAYASAMAGAMILTAGAASVPAAIAGTGVTTLTAGGLITWGGYKLSRYTMDKILPGVREDIDNDSKQKMAMVALEVVSGGVKPTKKALDKLVTNTSKFRPVVAELNRLKAGDLGRLVALKTATAAEKNRYLSYVTFKYGSGVADLAAKFLKIK